MILKMGTPALTDGVSFAVTFWLSRSRSMHM